MGGLRDWVEVCWGACVVLLDEYDVHTSLSVALASE